jgi:hypothetical protein
MEAAVSLKAAFIGTGWGAPSVRLWLTLSALEAWRSVKGCGFRDRDRHGVPRLWPLARDAVGCAKASVEKCGVPITPQAGLSDAVFCIQIAGMM